MFAKFKMEKETEWSDCGAGLDYGFPETSAFGFRLSANGKMRRHRRSAVTKCECSGLMALTNTVQ